MLNLSSTEVLLSQSCDPPGLQKEIEGPYGVQHKWLTKQYPLGTPLEEIPCTCNKHKSPGAKKVLPSYEHNNVIVYSNCMRTLYACMCRQIQKMPDPDPIIMGQFHAWFITEFEKEIAPLLDKFEYNPAAWFNHLTYNQQHEIIRECSNKSPQTFKDLDIPVDDAPIEYSMFCKREIQIVEKPEIGYVGSDIPKARAIATPKPKDKFTMGPVTWALETIFANGIKGYCGGKNWSEMEQTLSDYWNKGFKYVIFGDGSGWDRTQGVDLKLIDRTIYNYLVDQHKIHHVDPESFRTKTTANVRTMLGMLPIDGQLKPVFKASVTGTVMTGNTDTTLMNTTRMAMVCRFVMDHTSLEYELWCKGDDFIIFVKEQVDLEKLFFKYWCKKNEKQPHGLGVILKFLKTSTIDDFDFCSTNVIREGDKFKIVRLPNRMYPLSHWSVKALQLSHDEQHQYMIDQAVAIDRWAGKMPFFSEYADLIRFFYHPKTIKLRLGKKKITLRDGPKLSDQEQIDLEKGFDYYHSARLRVSNTVVSDEAVYNFLLRKYNMSRSQIEYHFKTCRELGVVSLSID